MCSRLAFSACAPPTCCGGRIYRSYSDAYFPSGFGAPCCSPPVFCKPACGVSIINPQAVAAAAMLGGGGCGGCGPCRTGCGPCGGGIPSIVTTRAPCAVAAPCAIAALPVTCCPCERPYTIC